VCVAGLVRRCRISNEQEQTTRLHEINTTLFLFVKKKTCAKRKTKGMFLVKVFTEGKKSCVKICVILCCKGNIQKIYI